MSDTQRNGEPRSAAVDRGWLSWLDSRLKIVSSIILTLGVIGGAVWGVVTRGCDIPMVASLCGPILPNSHALLSKPNAAIDPAEIQRRIAGAGIQLDPQLETVKLHVWRQSGVDDLAARLVVAGLSAKGFSVTDGITNLANANVDDKSPGKIWIKSILARKDLRETVRATIRQAYPEYSAKDIAVSDYDIPSEDAEAIKRAGEIQVDMF